MASWDETRKGAVAGLPSIPSNNRLMIGIGVNRERRHVHGSAVAAAVHSPEEGPLQFLGHVQRRWYPSVRPKLHADVFERDATQRALHVWIRPSRGAAVVRRWQTIIVRHVRSW